jgi:hypothetical protein
MNNLGVVIDHWIMSVESALKTGATVCGSDAAALAQTPPAT